MSDSHFIRHHADLPKMIISLKTSRTSFPFSLTTNPWNPLSNPGLGCVKFLRKIGAIRVIASIEALSFLSAGKRNSVIAIVNEICCVW
jgi:hypothetical protein